MNNDNPESKKSAYKFITNNRAAALATVSKAGVPHVVSIYCVVHEDLSIYFMTRVEGRKFTNLTYQPKVAMAFTDEKGLKTIQLTGAAERVNSLKLEQTIWHDLMRFRLPWAEQGPVPAIQLFERGATNELAIIKVMPYEMTFANFEKMANGRYNPFFQKII
jgi:uncharacterized pyridoxamine 5'-phosphate oxidase family protein